MASVETEVSDDIFAKLKRADPKELEQRQEAINERLQATFQKSQLRLAELIDRNSTLPTTVSAVTVLGATNTRRSFLKGVVDPLLSANRDRPYTQSEVIRESAAVAEKLRAFDIFHDPVSIYFDKPPQIDADTTPTDVAIFYSVKERSRLFLKTGTDLGNAEGSAYANAQWRNIFGGAETLDVNASFGTKTRSSYSATIDTPVFSNPDLKFQLGGLQSSTQKLFASHEEILRGGFSKLRWLSKAGVHEVGYNGFRRTVTGLAQNASPTVRNDAGESFKSSISHTWVNDRRDNPTLPSRGYYMKTTSELAGFGPLAGDVAFFKGEVEQQTAIPIPIPGIKGDSGVSFTFGARAGMLYPLALSGQSSPSPSKINDRFQLGGPTDVRGFRLSGLGPHDGADAVGGDVYAAGGASLLMPLPRVGLIDHCDCRLL
ncbi:SAM50-like protein SPAC17C9.06 [Cyphellophora attinorum]|uniref:SAM50-like protein SPAC17C9.06 n=1 Tax=Cyphellophora attinorum TaxID=1664694 RepID=A0A0N0NN99_9EURO|nr:SAM50-like protein SPAC17C9.06 [Phialophora attinorum]KPI41278.1 SAM50-like protein SPAC17C9.06 [Phialophora attinorum]